MTISENLEKSVIEVKDLTIGYDDDFVVLKDMNFEVQRGEIFVILGGSGCGKSSLLKHLIGLLPPFSGDIFIEGERFNGADDKTRERIFRKFGVFYQSGALFGSETLLENVSIPLREFTDLPELVIKEVAKLKLSLVGLAGFEDFFPAEISGGMKKRAGIARAMALDPGILFFDEPSAGLDPITSADLDRLILKLRDVTGATMVIVTHELDSIFTVGDTAIILDSETKTIVERGNPRRLRSQTANARVREFLNRSSLRG